MTAAMASEQPAPRFRWAPKNNRHNPVAGGQLMTAAECAAWLQNDPERVQECRAAVVEDRVDCVAVTRPFLPKPVLYLGEHPAVAPDAASEPDARRELIRLRALFARDRAAAQTRVDCAKGVRQSDRRELAVLDVAVSRVDEALAALAPSRSETAVEANR